MWWPDAWCVGCCADWRSLAIARHRIDVPVSAGMALYPDDGDDVDTLMRQADRALYAAKRDGHPFASASLTC